MTELMSLSWPLRVIVHLPVLMSHTLARLSHDPVKAPCKGSHGESTVQEKGGEKVKKNREKR